MKIVRAIRLTRAFYQKIYKGILFDVLKKRGNL